MRFFIFGDWQKKVSVCTPFRTTLVNGIAREKWLSTPPEFDGKTPCLSLQLVNAAIFLLKNLLFSACKVAIFHEQFLLKK
jgi:hypothetical protein